jgi:hypothetical protein
MSHNNHQIYEVGLRQKTILVTLKIFYTRMIVTTKVIKHVTLAQKSVLLLYIFFY